MNARYTRRRFLADLFFVGGVIAVSAGLAATGEEAPPTPCPATSASPTCEVPMPGQMVAPPSASPTPVVKSTPVFHRPLPGRIKASPPPKHATGGKPMPPPPR